MRTTSLSVLVAVFCAIIATVVADLPTYPLCTTTKGFAGDVNSEFSLAISASLRAGEAIILAIRPVPYALGQPSWIAARLNATYKVAGAEVSALSDSFGLLQIIDAIDKETDVHIKIVNLRQDGATPFVFYSYHSGFRTCSLEVSPSASFSGPVPTHIEQSNSPALVYLRAIPPPGATSFRLDVTGNVAISFAGDKDDLHPVDIASSVANPIAPTTVLLYFTLRPNGFTTTQLVHASISYTTSPPVAPNPPAAAPTPNSGDGAAAPVPQNAGPQPAPTAEKVAAKASGGFFSALIVVILVYFAGRSIYNYRVKKVTDFPDFVPHHEVFSGAAALCGTAAKHMRDKGRSTVYSARGGYNDVNRDEMYEAS